MNRTDFLAIMSIFGFVVMVVFKMNIGYMICWLLLMALISFWWVPVISNISTKYFSLSKKVNEVMVQYNEFKETIYPILEIELANIVSTSYLGVSTKTTELIDFIKRVENLELKLDKDEKLKKLIYAAKAEVINSFAAELAMIRQKNNLKTNMKKYIYIDRENYSSEEYIKDNAVYIDIDALKNSANDFNNNDLEKLKYKKKIDKCINFYNKNF